MPDGNNQQIIENIYAAFSRGDAGAVLGAFHPGIVWLEAENGPYADSNPYVGPAAVAEGVFGRLMTEWEGFTVGPGKYVTENDTVAVVGRYHGKYAGTQRSLDAQFVHVWTVRDGKVIAFQQFTDTAQFAAVCGAPLPGLSV